jgi:F0F1-type ATP synthase assembly protein I
MAQKTPNTTENQKVNFVFGKLNYQLLIASIVIVAIGFFLMSGETDIYSTTKIVVAPIVVISGFILGFVAVLKKSGE